MPTLQKVNVFLSYSHKDETLKEQMDAHLSALKRSGAIETWNDRKIVPGDEWEKEIDKRLTEADVILLLISSDFLASDFCYRIETLNALERHGRGTAVVIPVVLRDVDFRGLPIASLQMLPRDAVPVTSSRWGSQDEAFKDVAEGVRKSIESLQEQRLISHDEVSRPQVRFESRHLDAAIAGEIPVGSTREVLVLVRANDSTGLVGILPEALSSGSFSTPTASEVRSAPFQARYVISPQGALESPPHRLSIDAPDLLVSDSDKRFLLELGQDSARFTFLVTAQRPGEQYLRVNLFRGALVSAEVLLKSKSGGDILPGPGGIVDALVASVKLTLNAIGKSVSATG